MHSTTEAFGLLRRWPPSRFKTNEATFQRCRWTAESIFVLFVICLTITSWRSFPAPYALLGLGAADSFWNSMTRTLVENETTRSCQSRSFKLFASESFIWQRRRANTDQRKIAHKYGTAIKSPNSVKENRAGGHEITLSRWPIISRGARWVFCRPFLGPSRGDVNIMLSNCPGVIICLVAFIHLRIIWKPREYGPNNSGAGKLTCERETDYHHSCF